MSVEQLVIFPVSIVAFIVLLMFIVFFHEFGHFSAARLLGIRVDTFSIGFGKPIFKRVDKKGTEWQIAMLPLGGYVKFFGDMNAASQQSSHLAETSQGEVSQAQAKQGTTQFPTKATQEMVATMSEEDKKVCFHFKPVWARAIVVAAGPMANFVLAVFIFAGLLMFFGQQLAAPIVGSVADGGAGQEAGFLEGDKVLSIDGNKVQYFQDIQRIVSLSSDDELAFNINRGGVETTLLTTPRRSKIVDDFGNVNEIGFLGLGSNGEVIFKRYGLFSAAGTGVLKVQQVISTTVKFLGRLIVGKESAKQLGGPVKMAKYAGQAASSGFNGSVEADVPFWNRLKVSLANFVNIAAFVSVSIGFLNLLPIPVLDGGHLMFYAYEGVFRKPMNARVQAVGFQVGLIILLSFMVFVTWNDVTGLFVSTNS